MPQIAPIAFGTDMEVGTDILNLDVELDPVSNKDGLIAFSGGIVVTNNTTSVVTQPPTSPALQTTLTTSVNRPTKTSKLTKVRFKIVKPAAALDTAGLTTSIKSHENSVDVTYLFSEKSTQAEREELDQVFQAFIADPLANEVIRKLKSWY